MGQDRIEDLTQQQLDQYIVDQAIAVTQASGFDIPREVGEDFLYEMEAPEGYRFDVLEAVFQCISFCVQYKRYDEEVITAFGEILDEVPGLSRHQDEQIMEYLSIIATDTSNGFTSPLVITTTH